MTRGLIYHPGKSNDLWPWLKNVARVMSHEGADLQTVSLMLDRAMRAFLSGEFEAALGMVRDYVDIEEAKEG